jgi:hypothetical protein
MEEWIEAFKNDCREHKIQAAFGYGGLAALGAVAWMAFHDRRDRSHNAEIHDAYRELHEARRVEDAAQQAGDSDHRPGTYDMTEYEARLDTAMSRRSGHDR